MRVRSVYSTKEEIKERLSKSKEVYLRSQFGFLNEHNGLRKGCLHLILGISGGGKSTLTRSMILDVLLSLPKDKKVLVVLSEESHDDFVTELYKSGLDPEHYKRIETLTEMDDMLFPNEKHNFMFFTEEAKREDIGVIFYDNITTSMFYMDQKVSKQAEVAKAYKKLASAINKPLVLIAHTDAKVTENVERLINMNDIRGSKSIVNLAQYLYILQRFTVQDKFFSTIRILKHRGQNIETSMFQLKYHKVSCLYPIDKKLSFDEFKEAYKTRNKL